ncbi:histidine phosphatase family protein [Legionella jordanis]|uniref:Phosphoserine phosphatase 1 n=1 Tax=Legionella jordanis TaxID=456 RepID=A0A0W0VFY2_9GAMM|nr:histidine phosphatase family protein [Legionella jordanis]KTD19044.1 Phosphoserine phosphatase 1 [Legionella jordanis]RMX05401.1 phosphoglycerate mutase [Legionella jordanis]VEH13147.1 bifunctional RNase H/acid phosphatase [Legionella jordanis]HAT8714804.1 phosphoglycerate mutase [Legionella jordanis]
MTNFLLIRHATNDTVGKLLAGRMKGVTLNGEGRLQADHLSIRLAGLPITAIYSSPLERAIETAEPIARRFNLQIEIREEFTDIEFGNWTNCKISDIEESEKFRQFNTFRSFCRIPGGETMLEAQQRMITGIEKLHDKHPNETIAIVSHADLIKSAVAYYAGIHLDMFQRIEISPASVSMIGINEHSARIFWLNDSGELKTERM